MPMGNWIIVALPTDEQYPIHEHQARTPYKYLLFSSLDRASCFEIFLFCLLPSDRLDCVGAE